MNLKELFHQDFPRISTGRRKSGWALTATPLSGWGGAAESTDKLTSFSISSSNHFCSQSSIFLEFLHLRIYPQTLATELRHPATSEHPGHLLSFHLAVIWHGVEQGRYGATSLTPWPWIFPRMSTACTWASFMVSVTTIYCWRCNAQARGDQMSVAVSQ